MPETAPDPHGFGGFPLFGEVLMPRTALCRVCLQFITADHQRDLILAVRDHALDQPDTHSMAEIGAVDVEAAFTRLIGQGWGVKEADRVRR